MGSRKFWKSPNNPDETAQKLEVEARSIALCLYLRELGQAVKGLPADCARWLPRMTLGVELPGALRQLADTIERRRYER